MFSTNGLRPNDAWIWAVSSPSANPTASQAVKQSPALTVSTGFTGDELRIGIGVAPVVRAQFLPLGVDHVNDLLIALTRRMGGQDGFEVGGKA